MARFLRASLLKTALGVALATLVAVSPAAAATGGATPSVDPETSGGGAAPMAAVAADTGSGSAGGAAAGTDAAGGASSGATNGASSRKTGGAAAGAKPPRRTVTKRVATKRRATVRRQTRTPSRRAATRRAAAPAPAPVDEPATVAGIFPVVGSYTFGGDGSRFGSGRPGHIHQGQDVAAANGTPLVAPVAGTVTWKANQPSGAGIYLVVRGAADGRDYVFMHLKHGSVLVAPGQAVAAGDQLAQVGSTGASSGPHLHFEIWVGGWQARGGAPIDPLPQLQRWAAGTA